MFTAILSLIILIGILLFVDFYFGRKQHKQKENYCEFPKRYASCAFFSEGHDFFKALFTDIEKAKNHIHLQFYIVRNDSIGNRMINLLSKKAKEGVNIRLLADYLGSKGLSRDKVNEMKKNGVEFSFSNKPKLPFLFYTLNQRNHRKIVIIDGGIGYIGGYNVGDEYLGRDPKLGNWRDYHLRIEGNGVQDLQAQFLSDWKQSGQTFSATSHFHPVLEKGKTPLYFVSSDGIYGDKIFLSLLSKAKRSIMIGSPYYIPTKHFNNALIQAAKKGIKVTLLLPFKTDHPLVKEASFPYFASLIDMGVDIYHYHQGFFHSKVIIIDEEICDIGSANIDKRSFRVNDEINCIFYDSDLIQEVVHAYERDIQKATKLTKKQLKKRTIVQKSKEKVATLISDFL